MDLKFQNIRAAYAKLIGNPSISEAIASELDTALLADESSVGAKLAEHTNQGEEHEAIADVAVTVPVAGILPVVVAAIEENPKIVAEETADSKTALEAVLLELKGIRSGMSALTNENAKLKAENDSLSAIRAAASPKGVFSASENGTAKVQIGRNKSAEKDEAELADKVRLAEMYGSLMSDIVVL